MYVLPPAGKLPQDELDRLDLNRVVDDYANLERLRERGYLDEATATVQCRAKVSDRCYHGKDGIAVGYDGGDWTDDGTFDGASIVCDPCYIALGCPLNPVLPGAVA